MGTYAFGRYAVSIGAAAALLAACAGLPVGQSKTQDEMPARKASVQQLIYVVDHDTSSQSYVDTYSYPDGKPIGQLTGFGWLYGDCADTHGDVFMLNAASPSTIIEYPPGGTTPIKVFDDAGYSPYGCSVDPRTGNLSVANIYSDNYTSGTIAIFTPTSISGRPILLTDPNIYNPAHCGYDGNGNLYLVGYNKSLQILFAELPARSTQFVGVTLNQTIDGPSNLQWDGKYMAIGDSSTNVIYQFSMDGSAGTEVGSTTLGGVTYGLTQFWIDGSRVIGAAAVDKKIGVWKYPAGGAAVKVIKQKTSIPVGVAVSSP